MAKIKNVEPIEEVKQVALNETEAKDVEAKKNETEAKKDVPDFALSILRLFPSEQKLYVSQKGCAFTESTSKELVKDAVLYENPYYNKQ